MIVNMQANQQKKHQKNMPQRHHTAKRMPQKAQHERLGQNEPLKTCRAGDVLTLHCLLWPPRRLYMSILNLYRAY